ncbi:MAG TPA: Gfo/Idh/MocA family oxidoreductase [Ferruginibacter sp.]|nr:Gfo/Idh/MocA family oxidoreductase [Ferruginibacter sp.]HMZ99462.1 Gfo/Idh/MocA family oxidoreductase [Ferruginibacter sp.]HNA15300.1 Gfo/Idh/MocA family oxidoreductase [Ferruginibacter sp.]HNF01666.1 Gfo/Idh/MocA family oxidoreductase [Ferruginibacter sp.]HNJ27727.1 Gfo/Idh/MocA family oxidoreductase [Ferruginibacter sp.]
MINVGIIGYGYWGPNLVRNFFGQKDCVLKSVADARPNRLELLAKAYPSVQGVLNADGILNDPAIDAVVIATPVFTHFPLAQKALQNGKHVLLEKPMASSVQECNILIGLATQKNLLLMVDHTFLYTGAVEKIKELIDTNALGNVKYLDSTRINLGLFQPDINVLWDLAPHDLSILRYLHDETPYSVNATGISHTHNGIENIAFMTINYQSGFIAHLNCSWSSPVKVRMMLIGGDQKMIIYNDVEPTEKIKVYDTGYELKSDEDKNKILVDYRVGDIYVPKVNNKEALAQVASDFIGGILEKRTPRSSHHIGLDIVKMLEASEQSIKNKGAEVKIS